MKGNFKIGLIVAVVVMGVLLLWMMGVFTYEPPPADEITTGDALIACQEHLQKSYTVNLEFEGAFQVGVDGRSEQVNKQLFRIRSWYDTGDGSEQRFTCSALFRDGPDDPTVSVTNGW